MVEQQKCPKCNNTSQIKEKDGTIHICYDCLMSGRFDQHDKKIKTAEDLGIKL